MECPYCGREMREGAIPAGSQLKWVDRGGEDTAWGEETPLNGFSLFGGEVRGFLCPDCRRIILPVPEIEGVMDKLRRGLGTASERLDAARTQWETRRGEEKERRQAKKFGEKDPWEL